MLHVHNAKDFAPNSKTASDALKKSYTITFNVVALFSSVDGQTHLPGCS